ncbi:unnamed protein product, partial [Brugia timori]|uniref:BHLH domain-containing protein n=1 Tax=Brugia timori TaxID=42155 RepID=A0A0R3RD84_9BILA
MDSLLNRTEPTMISDTEPDARTDTVNNTIHQSQLHQPLLPHNQPQIHATGVIDTHIIDDNDSTTSQMADNIMETTDNTPSPAMQHFIRLPLDELPHITDTLDTLEEEILSDYDSADQICPPKQPDENQSTYLSRTTRFGIGKKKRLADRQFKREIMQHVVLKLRDDPSLLGFETINQPASRR